MATVPCLRCAQENEGWPLPKFGEWDVKNPASADGFTVIFQRARDDKKTTGPRNAQGGAQPSFRNSDAADGYRPEFKSGKSYQYASVATPKRVKKRWFFCCC